MRLLGILLVLVVAAICPARAHAGVLSVRTTTTPADKYSPEQRTDAVTYVAGPGEVNDVEGARLQGDVLTFADRAGVTPGPGCVAVGRTSVTCVIANSFEGISASLGDGDDRFVDSMGATIDGGPGDDVLQGADLLGGSGNDVLSGRQADGGPGADSIDAQIVSYHSATGPVRVDLRDLTHAGQAGEDRLSTAVQNITGSSYDDVLIGDERSNTIRGEQGNDQIVSLGAGDSTSGGDGDDLILSGAGDDSPSGDNGDDHIDAGPGDDLVHGGYGNDTINGGAGEDNLSGDEGADRLDGGPGSDYLDGYIGADLLISRDHQLDALNCGPPDHPNPRSVARADTRDLVHGCGHVSRPRSAAAVLLPARQTDGTLVRVEIGCSQDITRGCRGTLQLLIGPGHVVDQRHVRLIPGAGRGYLLKVSANTLKNATRDCRALRATILFTDTSRTPTRRQRTPATLTSTDTGCPRRPRPHPPITVTNW